MATQNQIRANQANARKSTGPRTADGKLRSAQNGLTHGLYAATPLALGVEDQQHAATLRAALLDQYNPQTPMESILCEQLIQATWKLDRLARIENGFYDDDLNLTIRNEAEEFHKPPSTLADHRHEADSLLSAVAQKGADFLSKLTRQRAAAERSLYKALQTLEKVQKEKVKTEPNSPQKEEQPEPQESTPARPPQSVIVLVQKQQTEPNSLQTREHALSPVAQDTVFPNRLPAGCD